MSNINILQVLPELNGGGVELETVIIASYLAQKGINSYVTSKAGHLVDIIKDKGCIHIALPLHKKTPLSLVLNTFSLINIVKRENIDIIHVRSRFPAWSAYFASKITGTPMVSTFHGAYGSQNCFKRLYNSVMLKGCRVIAISDFIANYVEKNYGFQSHLVTIQRGVDCEYFTPIEKQTPQATILFPARFTRIKGHIIFLHALAQLTDLDFQAILLGAHPEKNSYQTEIEELIKSLDLQDRVKILPFSKDTRCAYAESDVVVQAGTKPEAFCRVVIETQAMERTIIAPNIGAPKDLIQDSVNGFLFEASSPQALSDVLRKVFKLDKNARQRIAQAGRLNVLENFTQQRMCERTLALYKEVLQLD